MNNIIFPIIVMGVTGCGKSIIGGELATVVGANFTDGDDLHPKANIAKMRAGTPLTDDDRWGWLDRIAATARNSDKLVISCSALKKIYRDHLRRNIGRPVQFVFLDISRETSLARLRKRNTHFMPVSLVSSQFDTLERPEAESDVLSFVSQDGQYGVTETVTKIIKMLNV